jgi:hypothetical protein
VQGVCRLEPAQEESAAVAADPAAALQEWRRAFRQHGRGVDSILAGAAHHRQFVGDDDDELVSQVVPAEALARYQAYRELALQYGFGRDNPAVFLMHHVYASSLRGFLDHNPMCRYIEQDTAF